MYYSLSILALYYIGTRLQAKDIVTGLIQTQIFIILIPVLAVILLSKNKIPYILRLRPTPVANYFVIPFFALSGAVIAALIGQFINLVYPIPEDYLKNMAELLKLPNLKLWQIIGLIAFLPGICEEIMFRGFIYRFFEGKSHWHAIWISASLFALFHLDPYRFLPVLFLGLMLGWLLYKTNSIIPSMLSHTINNSAAIILVQISEIKFMKHIMSGNDNFQWWLGIPATVILLLSVYYLNKINDRTQKSR
jgi:membrane protease YdiL (CAAX protease family)